MVEDPNLFWFGVLFWLGGTAYVLSLFGSKTQPTEELSCELEYDGLLCDRLTQVGIPSWIKLQRKAGLTPRQLRQLRQGSLDTLNLQQMNQLAQTLDWTLEELLQNYNISFSSLGSAFQEIAKLHQKCRELYQEKHQAEEKFQQQEKQYQQQLQEKEESLTATTQQVENTALQQQQVQEELEKAQQEIFHLQKQCRRLREDLQQQTKALPKQVQEETFEQLQTLLMNFPTATVMGEAKPLLPAKNFIPLFTPLKNLLRSWGYETIGKAWEQVTFDPKYHQPDSEDIQPGELVYIRFVGYRDGDRILCPAKVSRSLPKT